MRSHSPPSTSSRTPDPYAKMGAPLSRVPCRSPSPPTSPSSFVFSVAPDANASESSLESASTPSGSVPRATPRTPSSTKSGVRAERKKKSKGSKAVDIAMRGVSTMLLIPMPFLESVRDRAQGKGKRRADDAGDDEVRFGAEGSADQVDVVLGSGNGYMAYADDEEGESNTVHRLLSLRPSLTSAPKKPEVKKAHRKHNSLALPHVDVPSPISISPRPSNPLDPRPTPPPSACRSVRFSLEAPPTGKRRTDRFEVPEGRGEDEEPAWSDFM
uniref:Uncharacterized protein n=1 Tax=Mycena chlorophos TaxID=658473 RepID=A0ABQ0LWF4_MYCCL|nr:predicted protein [Mycena chlorophos]